MALIQYRQQRLGFSPNWDRGWFAVNYHPVIRRKIYNVTILQLNVCVNLLETWWKIETMTYQIWRLVLRSKLYHGNWKFTPSAQGGNITSNNAPFFTLSQKFTKTCGIKWTLLARCVHIKKCNSLVRRQKNLCSNYEKSETDQLYLCIHNTFMWKKKLNKPCDTYNSLIAISKFELSAFSR